MAQDRDAARLRIARAGLTQAAVERVSRPSFGRMPITLVDRARAQLRRFFSEARGPSRTTPASPASSVPAKAGPRRNSSPASR